MCDYCTANIVIEKLKDPQVWFPVFTGITAYFAQAWVRMVLKRKEQSRIAAIYLREIRQEVEIGIERLEYLYTHAGQPYKSGEYRPIMPTQNWTGVRDILPDDIFRRLCNVARHKKDNSFDDLRFHLKNYFTVICKFGNEAILGDGIFDKTTARVDLDGARMVSNLLKRAEYIMENNAKCFLWPW